MTDRVQLRGPAANVQMHRDEGTEIVADEVWDQDCYRLADLAAGRVFVDVGANVGAATLAAIAYGATEAVAVEPDAINLDLLHKNIAASEVTDLVDVHACAVGRPHGRVRVHRSSDYPDGCYGSSWTAPTTEDNAATVTQQPLEEFLPTGSDVLLKIDTEGAEYEILAGCGLDVLAARAELIVMEWHDFPDRGVDAYEQLAPLVLRLLRRYDIEVTGPPHRGGLLFARRR